MGLHRLYWIPEGFDARHGAYVTYPADELRALVALEAHRAGAVVVGEDLGTVGPVGADRDGPATGCFAPSSSSSPRRPPTPLPRPAGRLHRLVGEPRRAPLRRLLPRRRPPERRPTAAATGGPTPSGPPWRAELATRVASDPELRAFADAARVVGGSRPRSGPPSRACLAHLAAGPPTSCWSTWATCGRRARQENRPGTGAEADNWRHRTATTLEAIRADPEVAALLALVDSGRKTGRRDQRRRASDDPAAPRPARPGRADQRDDVYWFNEGTHRGLAAKLGGHPLEDPEAGAVFAVWAPSRPGGVR